MGFDVSYHPITREKMDAWYFDLLPEVRQDSYAPVEAAARKWNIDEDFLQTYKDVLAKGADCDTEENFDTGHGYFLAVVQGLFGQYYYNRGTAYSFLIEEHPSMKAYTLEWEDILGRKILNPVSNRIIENYCGGVYIPPEQVSALLADYESGKVRNILDGFFEQNLPVFLKALRAAKENGDGLLEATDVIEVNPVAPNVSTCYSKLLNCDTEGVLIYMQTARRQLEEFARQQGLDADEVVQNVGYERTVYPTAEKPESKEKPKGFFRKLFGR